MKKKAIIAIGIIVILCLAGVGGFYIWQYNQAYHEVNVEAGITLTPEMFLVKADTTAEFGEGSDVLNNRVPGDYNVIVKTSKYKHKILVHIVDTIAPTAEAVDYRIDFGNTVAAEDFVKNISDATAVRADFEQTPDFSRDGKQNVTIVLTDLGGNTTKLNAELTISYIKKVVEVEAGTKLPELSDFLLGECAATLLSDYSDVNINELGEREVSLDIAGTTYTSTLKIVDTVAPELSVCDVTSFTKASLNVNHFVAAASDVTGVNLSFEKEPDVTLAGEQEVNIVATDAAGNTTVKTAKLTLTEDNEAPVIVGVKDIKSFSGHAIAFKEGVTVTDNNPEGITLEVEIGDLNVNVPGEYPVTYIATDASGNVTSQSIVVTIRGKEYTDEYVYQLADEVIAKIIKPNMTQRQKCAAIFTYVRKNLTFYTGHSTKLFWQQGAVDAFVDGIGDCFMYACMSRALLTRAGIENLEITRVEGARPTSHYWNLVNITDEEVTGWYHFDALTMKDGTKFLLWTDAQIKAYDETHPGYHTYDPALYPAIN